MNIFRTINGHINSRLTDNSLESNCKRNDKDWSKSIVGGGGGPEQRGGGSSVFEPLVRGGSFNFQLTLRGGSSCFFYGDWHTFDNKGNSFQKIKASDTLIVSNTNQALAATDSCFCLVKPLRNGIADR